ncbi:hypothetical protein JXA32_10225 [Candidatus Sumerlaeota bacterium]|nr:hypothetical protein [Candidatus Sumerlaeota bacterium]
MHGVPRVTQDIDIIISMAPENVRKTTAALKGLGYAPRLPVDADDLADAEKVRDWIENRNLKAFSFFHPKEMHKTVDIVLLHPLNFDRSYQEKVTIEMREIMVHLAPIADLMQMKEVSGRDKDISDVEMLKKRLKLLN